MEEATKTPKPHTRRWIISLALLAIVASASIWFFHTRTIWTDGQGNPVPSTPANLREVLWTPPIPLDPDLLSTPDQQYEPSLSPDATELYFVRGKPGHKAHIFVTYRRDNAWTKPAPLDAINGPTDDLSPRLTADGNFLLFSSDRSGGVGGFDLWASQRTKGGWSEPFNLGPGVNTEFNECNPDPTPDGKRLIFSTDRKAAGKEQTQAWRATIRQTVSTDYDLWIASLDAVTQIAATSPTSRPATTQATATLVLKNAREISNINTASVEGASCISPAGDFLYFSSNRPGGFGKFDLYRSRITGENFAPPENLGPAINTADNEADPSLAAGGFRLYFSSDRQSHEGVYSLHQSDSHEVFAAAEPRHLPKFGWSIWTLLISILFLIPLIMAMSSAEWRRRLNTLQRCLLVSLLIHALLTFAFSFVLVTQEVARYVKHETTTEVAVNLGLPTDVQVGQAVRNQISADLPSDAAPPAPSERIATIDQAPQTAAVRTNLSTPAADRQLMTSIAMAAPRTAVAIAAPSPQTALRPAWDAAANLLDNLAPKTSTERVADPSADASPTTEKPATPTQRVKSSSVASTPAQAVTTTLPNTSETAQNAAAKPLTQTAEPSSKSPMAPAVAQAVTPSPAIAAQSDPSLNSIAPSVPNSQHLSEPAPTATTSAAPLPSAGPFATAIARPDINPDAAADIATRNLTAKPTTAPVVASTASEAVPNHSSAPIAVASAAVPAGAALGPVSQIMPDLPAIAPGPSRAAAEPTSPAPAPVTDTIASAPRANLPSAPSSAVAIDVSSAIPAAASVSSGTGPAINLPSPAHNAAPGPIAAPAQAAQPAVAFVPVPLGGGLDPGPFTAPSSPFPRSPEERKPRVAKLGGTKDSEDAVAKGIAYLARNQEPDGRWSLILQNDTAAPGRRPQTAHDIGTTGLSILALITHDHTPDKPGPYRETVKKALDFLIASQEQNGDLRGPPRLRGAGSAKGDLYDHAIATLALAETATMTGNPRYKAAALKGVDFIVSAQDPQTGGWRYIPGEAGDTSVFGWQIMAMHAAQQLGFQIPDKTREQAAYYISISAKGPRNMLASYRPKGQPTGTMTAEMMYARMLLGQKLSDEDIAPVTDFLAQQPPTMRQPNFYYWYYGSLCMMQAQNDDWKRWNTRSREALIALQNKGGPTDGAWDTDPKYADRGGRVYTTAIATLTLEVYYRYQPLRGN